MSKHSFHETARSLSRRPTVWSVALLCSVCACGDLGVNATPPIGDPMPTDPPAFTLQLLHAADQESGGAAVDDAPRFSAILDSFRAEMPDQTLVLSSGDNYIPGPFFSASDDPSLVTLLGDTGVGLADILVLNAIGFQASAFGNHEFDAGSATVHNLISMHASYEGTQFPYLSSNLDFSGSADLMDLVTADNQEASTIPNSIAATTIITVGGERFGIVGATTPTLGAISSPDDGIVITPADPDDIAALATEIQRSVDDLVGEGIDKIILICHMQQIAIESQLATLLTNVDIISAGGSNTILADANDRLRAGDSAAGTYPLEFESASGEPVLVVNTDGNYRYVGRLVVGFDEAGVIMPGTVDAAESGVYAADDEGVEAVGSPDPIEEVVTITEAIGMIMAMRDGNLFGKTDVFLNGTRTSVRTEETNLGDLTADANLAFAKTFDASTTISIKNGGGIRDNIGIIVFPPGSTDPEDAERLPPQANPAAGKEEGQVSQFDIENSLRFNNSLTLVTLTAAELVTIVEHAVAATEPGATPGQFAQVGGIRFSYDPTLTPGARVRNLATVDDAGQIADVVVQDGAIQGDPARTFRVVTLGFLADGGDSYPFPTGGAINRVDLEDQGLDQMGVDFAMAGTEQHALAWHLMNAFPDAAPFMVEDVPIDMDERIQNLSERSDTVLTP